MITMRLQAIIHTVAAAITVSFLLFAVVGIRRAGCEKAEISSGQIDDYIIGQMAQENIVGLSMAIIQDNETVYLKGFGSASLERQTEVTPQTIFDLASCSKSFTAMATLLLWNEGKIDLDMPLKHYIPEFELKDGDAAEMITVRQLLDQTSGLPGTFSEPLAYHQGADAMNALVASMKNIQTDREPGSSFEYTNLNYSLLGALVERVSGQSFDDFVEENIFEVLGMNNSTLNPEVAAGLDRADGHQLMLGKIITRNTPIYHSAQPAGWIMSSAEDMAVWISVNMNDGRLDNKQLIPASIIELMQTPSASLIKDGEAASYGMGWFIGESGNGEPVIWHGGDTSNFLSEMVILPERNLGLVMLVNSQTSYNAHDVALGVIGMLIGTDFELPSSPWWASWAAIDRMALIAFILSLTAVLGIIPYLWWQVRLIRRLRRGEVPLPRLGKTMKIWLFVLPATPWALLGIIAVAGYLVVQILFGFNLYQTLVRVGSFTPPGVLIAVLSIASSLAIWMILLTITGYLRAHARSRSHGS